MPKEPKQPEKKSICCDAIAEALSMDNGIPCNFYCTQCGNHCKTTSSETPNSSKCKHKDCLEGYKCKLISKPGDVNYEPCKECIENMQICDRCDLEDEDSSSDKGILNNSEEERFI